MNSVDLVDTLNLQPRGIHVDSVFFTEIKDQFILLLALCLPPISVVSVIDVFSEENKPFLFLRSGRKWVSRAFLPGFVTVSCNQALRLAVSSVETCEGGIKSYFCLSCPRLRAL